jgi:hypothetical protein
MREMLYRVFIGCYTLSFTPYKACASGIKIFNYQKILII